MVRNKYALLILLGIILASILSGCSTGTTTTPQTSSTFSSIEELALFVQAHSSGDTMGGRALAEPAMMLESRAVSDSVGSSAPDFSQTNNQVASVDEADVIKTDGLYIYTITDNTIFIVVAGDNPEIVATFDVEFQPSELFIVNDKLFVIGNQYDNVMFRSYPRSNAFSVVAIYDVSDRSIPSLDKTFEFEGMYFRGRMKGDYVYIVTNTLFDMRPIPMPIIMENGMQTRVGLSNVRRLADSYDNPSFVTIHAINTRNLELDSLSVIAESAHNMYMSENNIYLLHTNYINEYEIQRDLFLKETESLLNSEDISLIAEIRSINPLILSRWE
ncbi:MAG: beta-propeller domain-containing protein, partial [Candidatus Woesearchaeota archaeon]